MLAAVKAFLESKGYTGICTDYQPSQPDEYIGLFCWDHQPDRIGRAGPRYVQVRVRRFDPTDAIVVSKAITALLDSGLDETPLPLGYPGKVIGWPRRYTALLDRDERTVTYYSEIALWGKE